MPRPSSLSRSATEFRSRLAESRMRPSSGFPARDPLLGRLDAVIGRVPDQVQQRRPDLVEDRAVELDLASLDVEPDPLAEIAGQVADQPGEPLQHLTDRRHPRRDHLRLHLGGQPRDAIAHLGEVRVGGLGGERAEPILGHHQLADLLHQRVEPAEVHPDLTALGGGLGLGVVRLEAHRLDFAGGAERGLDLRSLAAVASRKEKRPSKSWLSK